MPSAEKTTSMAQAKVEVIQNSEQKPFEASQKDSDQNNGEKSTLSPIQQGLQIIQNKIRNLEKRKNKLDGYIKEEESGKELSGDQKKAVANYDEVVNQLGISKEFCKQIQVIATFASKEAKREAKKAAFLRQMQETTKVREVIIVQDFLRQLKNESIRNDFLQGSNGACLVDVDEMNVLEQFSKYTIPIHPSFSNEPSFMNSAKSAADHLSFLVDGRTRQFMETGFTYEKIKELFNRIKTCGYWEKDMKVVEVEAPAQSPSIITQERPAESETPQSSDDLESKDDNDASSKMGMQAMSAPLPAHVPNPTQLFNGMIPPNHTVPMHIRQPSPQQQQQQQQQQVGSNVQMKTTVTAVENAFFNQMKYSQGGPMIQQQAPPPPQQQQQQQPPSQVKEIPSSVTAAAVAPSNRIFEDFATANISFLQDSLVEQQMQNNQSQQQQQQQLLPQKMSNNYVSQPKPSPVQTQQPPLAANAPHQAISSFHHQQQTSTHHYPPGLKLQQQQQQQTASNIPGTFPTQQQASQAQQPNIPPHLIQQQQQSQPQQSYQAPPQQYQQKLPKNIQNLQDIEQKTTVIVHSQNSSRDEQRHDLSNRTNTTAQQQQLSHDNSKDKSRNNNNNNNNSNDWNAESNQQQPQIDTWTNETSIGNNNQGGNGNYSRFNRGGSGGGRGTGQNSKFNNYRGGSQQPRNNNYGGNNNENGDSGSSTFFRNNERYSGGGNNRGYNNNTSERGSGGGGGSGNFNKPRDSNYRAGSGRFLSGTVAATNSSQQQQRK